MAEQNTYTQFGLADIEKYLQGSMNAHEMHEMEKAALQDPFLFDAIEGYKSSSFETSYQHLNEITASLSADKQQAKIIAMPVKNRGWWRRGAAVASIAVAGITAWFLLGKPGYISNKAAIQHIPVVAAIPPPDSANADTKLVADNMAGKQGVVKNRSAKKTQPVAETYPYTTNVNAAAGKPGDAAKNSDRSKNGLTNSADSLVAGNPIASIASPPLDLLKKTPPVNVDTSTTYQLNIASNQLNNRVADNNNNNALANNNLKGPAFNANNFTPAKPMAPVYKQGFIKEDSTTIGKSSGFADFANKEAITAKKTNGASGNLNITLTPLPGFDTVAVTYLNNKNHSHKIVTDSTLVPKGGWETFRDYVSRQLHKEIDTTAEAVIEGDVELEFTVDDLGGAHDIKITRSLNEQSDAKAVDLVKKWPAWITTKKHKKGKVVIQF